MVHEKHPCYLHAARAQAGQLLHAISDAGVHGSATRENDVSVVEVAMDVQVALEDGVVTVWDEK